MLRDESSSLHEDLRSFRVWIVDCEQWPRACLRAELIERGYDVRGFVTIESALNALKRAPEPHMLILELRFQPMDRRNIEALGNLKFPIILIGGTVELNNPLLQLRRWERVLKRPVSLGHISDVVEKAIVQLASRTPETSHKGSSPPG
jgi:DNA-binding NtrC family response regulator